jgi:hypothetical protein
MDFLVGLEEAGSTPSPTRQDALQIWPSFKISASANLLTSSAVGYCHRMRINFPKIDCNCQRTKSFSRSTSFGSAVY